MAFSYKSLKTRPPLPGGDDKSMKVRLARRRLTPEASAAGGRTATKQRLGHRAPNPHCPPVRCSVLILMEAPSSAYRHGMLALGTRQHALEEETSGASPPR